MKFFMTQEKYKTKLQFSIDYLVFHHREHSLKMITKQRLLEQPTLNPNINTR